MIKRLGLIVAAMMAVATTGLCAHVDGDWFAEDICYGCPGDSTLSEVTDQQDSYNLAAHDAESILAGEKQGDLRAAQQKCVDLATWSYVKAEYAAAMGAGAMATGDTTTAEADYTACLQYAKLASDLDIPENVIGAGGDKKLTTSHQVGERFAEIAKRQLARIHRRKR